jgi:hypothetical protein
LNNKAKENNAAILTWDRGQFKVKDKKRD